MKRALALAMLLAMLLAIFVSFVSRLHFVEVVKANFVPGSPSITIDSPEENKTYTTSFVWLNITLLAFYDSDSWNTSRVAEFNLNGQGNISIPIIYEDLDEDGFSVVTGSLLLSDLSDGSHSMTVYATYNFLEPWNLYYSNSKTVNFTIDLLEPTPTTSPTEEPQSTEQDVTAGAVLAVASIVVFLGLLVCFIKRI